MHPWWILRLKFAFLNLHVPQQHAVLHTVHVTKWSTRGNHKVSTYVCSYNCWYTAQADKSRPYYYGFCDSNQSFMCCMSLL